MNMICFDIETLRDVFEQSSRKQLIKILSEEFFDKNDDIWGLLEDKKKVNEIVDRVSLIKDKGDVEIFTATYMMLTFFAKESKVCFFMKDGFNPMKDKVDTLETLKKNTKEYHDVDIGLLDGKSLRTFQLKSYRGKCDMPSLFSFLRGKIEHYSCDIGSTNFLITLQSSGDIEENLFQNIHKKLKELNIKGTGEILITYNENNKFDVLNTVYPAIGTIRIPFKRLKE